MRFLFFLDAFPYFSRCVLSKKASYSFRNFLFFLKRLCTCTPPLCLKSQPWCERFLISLEACPFSGKRFLLISKSVLWNKKNLMFSKLSILLEAPSNNPWTQNLAVSLKMGDTVSLKLRMHLTPIIPKITTLVWNYKWEIPVSLNLRMHPTP